MKKIMILGAGILQLPAIKKAKEMGLSVIAVDMDPNAVGFAEEGIDREVISTTDTLEVLKAAKRHGINGIMTLASDMPIRTIAVVARELGLAGVTEETALKATNKAAMRDALYSHSVPIPMYFKASSKEDYFKAVNEIKRHGCQCIIKPADNSGSRGVNLLKSYEKEMVDRAYEYSKKYSRSGDLVVEEYLEGPEVSVETLSLDGECHVIQITDKMTTGAPYFVETGHSQPSMLPADIQLKIMEVAVAANRSIGIENGPLHTEIKVTSEGPKIIELGARLGGDNITTHLVPLSTGVNMVECCIKIALGETPDYKTKHYKASAIRYLESKEGVIQKIEGVQNAGKIEGIKQISIVHGVGEHIKQVRSSVDRIGFVIAQADSAVEAMKKCENAIKEIGITYE